MASSECTTGAFEASGAAFKAALISMGKTADEAAQIVDNEISFILQAGSGNSAEGWYAVGALDRGLEELVARARGVQSSAEEGSWISRTGFEIVGKKGTPTNKYIFNQFFAVKAQARIAGQVREYAKRAAPRLDPGAKVLDDTVLGERFLKEFALRTKLAETPLRMAGVPLVTMKTVGKGEPHFSHVTFGDTVGILLKTGGADELAEAAFRSNDPTKNVPFQNIAEAVRVIVEHNELGLPVEQLLPDVLDALVNASGVVTRAADKKAQAATEAWMKGDGAVTVKALADRLVSDATRERIYEENTRQKIMNLAFSRGDGIQATDQVLKTIMESPFAGNHIIGMGGLLFDNGLQKILGKDIKVAFSADNSTLAFAEQFLAKAMANLHPSSLAVIESEYMAAKGMRQAARESAKSGKPSRRASNKARKQVNDQTGEAAAKIAKDDVANNPNGHRVDNPSLEGAEFAARVYNELKYGAVVGGLAKALSKISDAATMGARGKTMLLGTEHRILENAAIVSQGLVKFRESFNGNVELANSIFTQLKGVPGSRAELEAFVRSMPEGEQQYAIDMINWVDNLFGMGDHNMLLRNGIFLDDLATNLRAVGLPQAADTLPEAIHADEVFDYWRNLEATEGADIFSTMSKFYTAQQLSMFAPTMADSLARHFSHVAEGLDYATALKQGWRPIDEASSIGKYLVYEKTPTLFPPEMISKIKEMDNYINYDKTFGKMTNIIRDIDGITSIMKSSLTLWRPGHHMVSTIGNTFMNALAGVKPHDYGMAVKLMIRRGDVKDVGIKDLDELIKSNAPAGMKLKDGMTETIPVKLTVNGTTKVYNMSIDEVWQLADSIGGVPISPRRVRDTATADYLAENAGTRNWKNSGFGQAIKKAGEPVAKVDHQIARLAAARDNVARYSLFIKELRTGSYRNIEDAVYAAAQKVHEFHPTVGTLTAAERKYARRIFYFYTWQKQAFFKILEMAANKPQIISMPSKLQYALATAQGLDPDSFGDPYSAAGMWAAYNESSVYGPQFIDETWGPYGIKPALPQLDVIDSYLSPIQWKPEDGLWGNIGNMADASVRSFLTNNASPALTLPAAYLTQQTAGSVNMDISNKPPAEFLLDQTGLGTLSRVFDWTPWGQRSDTKIDAYAATNRDRLWWNWLTGLKLTYYQNPAALQAARQQNIDYWQKTLKTGKYAPRPSIYDIGE